MELQHQKLTHLAQLAMKNQYQQLIQSLTQLQKKLQKTTNPLKIQDLFEELLFIILTFLDQNLLCHEDTIKTGPILRRSTLGDDQKSETILLTEEARNRIQIAPTALTLVAKPKENVIFLRDFKKILQLLQEATMQATTAQEYIEVIESHEMALWKIITHVSTAMGNDSIKPWRL